MNDINDLKVVFFRVGIFLILWIKGLEIMFNLFRV